MIGFLISKDCEGILEIIDIEESRNLRLVLIKIFSLVSGVDISITAYFFVLLKIKIRAFNSFEFIRKELKSKLSGREIFNKIGSVFSTNIFSTSPSAIELSFSKRNRIDKEKKITRKSKKEKRYK
jgi:hypothetical protein